MRNNESKRALRAQEAQQLAQDIINTKELLGEMYVNRIAPSHSPATDDIDSWTLAGAIDVLIRAANKILSNEGLPEYRPKMESNCKPISAKDALAIFNNPKMQHTDLTKQAHRPHHEQN